MNCFLTYIQLHGGRWDGALCEAWVNPMDVTHLSVGDESGRVNVYRNDGWGPNGTWRYVLVQVVPSNVEYVSPQHKIGN